MNICFFCEQCIYISFVITPPALPIMTVRGCSLLATMFVKEIIITFYHLILVKFIQLHDIEIELYFILRDVLINVNTFPCFRVAYQGNECFRLRLKGTPWLSNGFCIILQLLTLYVWVSAPNRGKKIWDLIGSTIYSVI